MGRLIYSAITSLDGFVEDAQGGFEWAAPDPEVHAFVNGLERQIGANLYGRRMYETMAYWESVNTNELSAESREFQGIWRAAEKIVYSRTLQAPFSARTRIEREFDPTEVRQLKELSDRDITIGGAGIAGQALAAQLVDECQLFLTPVVVGAGKRALPANMQLRFTLLDERRFASGVVFLRYAVRA